MFGNIGLQEILIILLIVLLLFGAKRIPEVARALGKGIKEFRDSMKEIGKDIEGDTGEEKKEG
ncbi:preprotein translocase subunit TatA [candidate division TA06 bacterium DG_24]|uniref:Sec-independent protein translocase protein TatA n=3 Tax=Bacteria division TA06 TaxID=1156500 RepID=A0A0S8JMV5_UNCT6|nr:MAG: preprotein translocase subunit TatA [candidate division TA06 bacterium DG_24]KPK70289.1 MAG: preprotein translocase subunit TatA [candidate division TA06 bacterium SM23_40]KPL10754.1 MAG: preprotein translocase subunit TatA [candidate division TA06 bacterium SM1_40]